MCVFITSTLAKKVDIEKIKPIFLKNNFDLSPLFNKSIINKINTDCNYFLITDPKKHCDCGTFLYSGLAQNYDKTTIKKEIAKKKNKGWSDTKIQRWLKEKEDALTRQVNSSNNTKIEEIEGFIHFLHTILRFKEIKFIGILTHMYNGDIENEEIKLKSTKRININKLDTEFFLSSKNIENDVLYEFYK